MFCGRHPLSLEDKTVSCPHVEDSSSFLTCSPASRLKPLQPILHPESRAMLLKHKPDHVSPPPPKRPQNIQHLSQLPSYHCASLSGFISSRVFVPRQSLATPAFLLLHRCARITPCSGALYLLFPLPRMLFPETSAWLAPSHQGSPRMSPPQRSPPVLLFHIA